MVMETRRLKVSVGSNAKVDLVTVTNDPAVQPFVECYQRRSEPSPELEMPGDIAVRRLPLAVPAVRDGSAAVAGQVDLVVRLASPGARDPLLGQVALFRGSGMVVAYWDRSSLIVGQRPFHAVLVCGIARSPADPSPEDHAVELFLRAAEPPGHDQWLSTPSLKQTYRRGYAQALERLKDLVTRELRKLLSPRFAQGKKGPDRLQKRFPIGPRGGPGGKDAAFHFSRLDARFDGSRWHFSGEIRPSYLGRTWHATLSLQELGEEGDVIDRVSIDRVTIETPGVEQQVEHGVALIEAEASVRELSFSGISAAFDPKSGFFGELGLEIAGRLGELE
jgi:hypothetical protein